MNEYMTRKPCFFLFILLNLSKQLLDICTSVVSVDKCSKTSENKFDLAKFLSGKVKRQKVKHK